MSAAQLYLPANRAFNSNGLPVPGAVMKLYTTGTNTRQSFYLDAALTQPVAEIVANAAGRFDPPYQNNATPFRLRIEDSLGAELDDIDPYYFGTIAGAVLGTEGAVAPTRTDIAGLSGVAGASAILTESGREGNFVWSSANLSTFVSADPLQGIYVAPASDTTGASGAWVRKFSGPVDPTWFGVLPANSGASNDTAILAMFATLRLRAANTGTYALGVEPIRWPAGTYSFSSTIDLTDGNWIIEGAGRSTDNTTGTVFVFPTGVTGIRVQRYNTTGATSTRTAAKGADYSIIRNLALKGAYAGTEAEVYGIQLRARAIIENNVIGDFQGDGIYIAATAGGTPEGNANCFILRSNSVLRCRDGINIGDNSATSDVNAGLTENNDLSANRRWGIADRSFLGNTHVGNHTSTNGLSTSGSPSACVSYSGNRYGVISGQEVGASTNAPSGTTADNTWWYYISAGGVHAVFPAWVSGTTYRAGGSYFTNNSNARNLFSGCYAESDQGFPQLASPTLAIGGALSKVVGTGGWLSPIASPSGALVGNRGIGVQTVAGSNTTTVLVGEAGVPTTILQVTDTTEAAATWRLKLSGHNLILDYANGGSARPFNITGPISTDQFGTGAAVPYAFHPINLMVGDYAGTIANARRIGMEASVPAANAHAQGEIVFNRTPAQSGASSNAGWKCRTAGTPGTWDKFGGCAAAPTATYAAPSGGTTVDTEGRASLAQLAADLADLKTKLQTAGLTL
jgi:hypothetical protein